MVTLAATIFVGIFAINIVLALLGAVAGGIESSNSAASLAQRIEKRKQQERDFYSMPMAQLDAEIARAAEKHQAELASVDGSYGQPVDVVRLHRLMNRASSAPNPYTIREQRKEFDNHPDAKLLPDGVKKLAELKQAHSTRAFVLKTEPLSGDTSHWDKKIASLEAELAKTRRRSNRRAA